MDWHGHEEDPVEDVSRACSDAEARADSGIDLGTQIEDGQDDLTMESMARAFKEKLASISFPGRGKADRSRPFRVHGNAVSDAHRELKDG